MLAGETVNQEFLHRASIGIIAHGHDDVPAGAAKCPVRQYRGFRLCQVTGNIIRVVIGRSANRVARDVNRADQAGNVAGIDE